MKWRGQFDLNTDRPTEIDLPERQPDMALDDGAVLPVSALEARRRVLR